MIRLFSFGLRQMPHMNLLPVPWMHHFGFFKSIYSCSSPKEKMKSYTALPIEACLNFDCIEASKKGDVISDKQWMENRKNYQERTDLFDIAKLPTSATDQEGIYYSRFEKAYEERDPFNQILYLEKLSEFFLHKKELKKASQLINSALVLAKRYHFEVTEKHLLKRLEKVEKLFLQGMGIKATKTDYLYSYRDRLFHMREEIQKMIDRKELPEIIQNIITQLFQELLTELIKDCIELLQDLPPTNYAILGFGSMARKEMSLFSDIEIAVLLKTATETNKKYFRRLSEFLELRMINMGETAFPLLRIKKGPSETSFTPKGFCLDSGGITPLGKSQVYELICTPQELAEVQKPEWLRGNEGEIVLVNALHQCCLVMGSERLFTEYVEKKERILDEINLANGKKNRENRSLQLLEGHVEEFKPWLGMTRIQLRAFDIKNDWYRPLQMFVGALMLYYGVKEGPTLAGIDKLEEKGIFSSQGAIKLRAAFRFVSNWRLSAHTFYQSEKEIVYNQEGENDPNSSGLLLSGPEDAKQFLALYRTLIPFFKSTLSFVQNENPASLQDAFFDPSIGDSSKEVHEYADYESAERSLIESLAISPGDKNMLYNVQRLQAELSQYNEALLTNQRLLASLQDKYKDRDHEGIVLALMYLGIIHTGLGNFSEAISHLRKAEEMYLRLVVRPSVDLSLLGAHIFMASGVSFLRIGNVGEAERYLVMALMKNKEIFKDQPHPSTADILFNLGGLYLEANRLDQAERNLQDALIMNKNVFKEKEHSSIADCWVQLASVHLKKQEYIKSLESFRNVLQMQKRVFHSKPHLAVADTILNLGQLLLECKRISHPDYPFFQQQVQKMYCEHFAEEILLENLEGACFNKVIKICKQTANHNCFAKAQALHCLAILFQKTDSKKALEHAKKSFEIMKDFPEGSYTSLKVRSLQTLSELYYEENQFAETKQSLQTLLSLQTELLDQSDPKILQIRGFLEVVESLIISQSLYQS